MSTLSANRKQPIPCNLCFAAHDDVSTQLILGRWETSVFLRKGIGIKNGIELSDAHFAAILLGKFGWGGRIRTFTILINSEVSYRLDHAPAGLQVAASARTEGSRPRLPNGE